MGKFLAGVAFLGVVGTVLRLLEHRYGARPPRPLFTRTGAIDLIYWLVTGPIGDAVTGFALIGAVTIVFPALVLQMLTVGHVGQPFVSPFTRLPLFVQAPLAFIIIDLCTYWSHRIQHVTGLWRFHAIHHAPRELDWLAAARNHPIGEGIGKMIALAPLVLLGVDGRVLAAIVPFVGLWGSFLHANVRWTFGPLRYVIATPLFHRWHHSRAPEARDKNFAGLLPIWDVLFGTLYLPAHQPTDFGVGDHEGVPDGFFAQMLHPFRRRTHQPRRSASSTAARMSGLESFGSAASAESLRATCSSTPPST
jgi:sterol desaturase/sphingolipid hydroxylase (fatty acid hydroxylase superfamily)